jgi:hypothetical protein
VAAVTISACDRSDMEYNGMPSPVSECDLSGYGSFPQERSRCIMNVALREHGSFDN